MCFFYYLSEIRYRLSYLSISFLMVFCTCYYYSLQLIYLFACPFLYSKHYSDSSLVFDKGFIFTNLTEALYTTLKICFIWSFIFFLPFFLYQFWCFFTPSWYFFERKIYKIYMFSAVFLAFLGSFCFYFLALPELLNFLLNFTINTLLFRVELTARIDSYVRISSAIFLMVQSFFLSPLLFSVLYYFGYIDSVFLSNNRKSVVLCILLWSAFVSPPDPAAELLIFLFLLLIFEFFIWIGFFIKNYIPFHLGMRPCRTNF